MKRVLFVLLVSLLAPAISQAQGNLAPYGRVAAADSIRLQLVAPIARPTTPRDSVQSIPSHAVRNGAIVGAVLGAIAGGYAGSRLEFGCKTLLNADGTAPPCHAQRDERIAAIVGTLIGAGALSLVGAGIGKISQLLD